MTTRSILYVDANPTSRRVLTRLLEDFGVDVVAIEDPHEALEVSRSQAFDLAVLDYHMPAMTGTELAQKFKAMQPGTPVILVSGSISPEAHELGFVDAHFATGASLGDFLDTVRTLVEINTISIAKRSQPASWVDST